MDTQTHAERGPMTEQEMVEQIKALVGANTLIDAMRTIQEWKEVVKVRPVVWTGEDNALHVAPLTVRQTVQLITALEGLTVK
jgi:hypothetical protein